MATGEEHALERLDALLEQLSIGVAFVDAETRAVDVNRRGREIADLREGGELSWFDWRGRPVAPDASPVVRALRGELITNERLAVETADGRRPVLEVNARPVHDGDGRIVAALLTYDDVGRRQQREQADREFVSNAAHQLRTPLTAIASVVAVLQGGAKEIPEERDRFLAHLERETDRLARLGRALLALARAQRDEEQPTLAIVPLQPLLKGIVDQARPKDGVAITLDCSPELAATANAELLEEALGNVVANAVSYTDAGRIDVAATRADGAVRIQISDTGPGIPEEARARAFDRFFRGDSSRRGGFGLGLPIAKAAIEAAGGEIELESTSRGTTARIVLPGAALIQ